MGAEDEVKKKEKPIVVNLPEVEVKAKKMSSVTKLLRKIGRFFSGLASGGSGGTQRGGIPFVTNGNPASPTKQTAEFPDDPVNIDLLLLTMSRANAGKFQGSSLDFANSLKSVTDITKNESSSKATSDIEIIKKSTGIGPKTDAKGKQIKIKKDTKTSYDIADKDAYHAWYNGKHGAYKKGDTVQVTTWEFNSSTNKWTIRNDSIYPSRKK